MVIAPAVFAQATTGKKVAVFVVKGKKAAPAEAAAMQTLLRKQLGSLAGVRQLTGSEEPAASLKQLVASKLEQGFRLLNDKKGPEAEVIFGQVMQTTKTYTGTVNKRTLARTFKGLGVARAMQGKLTAARDMIKASMNVWPDQTAPEYGYTVEVRDTFTEVENRIADEKKGSISIESEPPGAEVRIGGDVKGFTPLTVEGLPTGQHFVQVQQDGYIRANAMVKVLKGEEAAEAFALKPNTQKAAFDAAFKKAAKKPGSKGAMVKALPAIKQILGADGVLFMSVASGKKGYIFDGYYVDGAGTLLKRRETISGDVSAILETLGRLVSRTVGAPLIAAQEPVPLDAPPQTSVVTDSGDVISFDPNDLLKNEEVEADSVVDKWWFWTIVAVAVGGVSAMVVALVTSEGDANGPVGTVVLDLKAAP